MKIKSKYYILNLFFLALILIIYMNKITLLVFYNNLFYHVILLVILNVLGFVLLSFMYNFLYILIAVIYGMKVKTVKMIPFLFVDKKVVFSFHPHYILNFETCFDISNAAINVLDDFIKDKNKISQLSYIICLILTFVILIFGRVSNIPLIELLLFVYCSWFFSKKYFNMLNINNLSGSTVFFELVFASDISDDIFDYHYQYLMENIKKMVISANNEYTSALLLFLFACENNYNDSKEQYLQNIDIELGKLLSKNSEDISIKSRVELFDYIEMRIYLLWKRGKDASMKNLEIYIDDEWNIYMPKIYIEKYENIITANANGKKINIARKYYKLFIKEI